MYPIDKETDYGQIESSCDIAKEYTIPLRKIRKTVAVNSDDFRNYFRDINAFRRRAQRKGRCRCPQAKWLYCDMDCFECRYRVIVDEELDAYCYGKEGKSSRKVDLLDSAQEPLEERVLDEEVKREVVEMMKQLLPEWELVERLKDVGYTNCQIEEATGLKRSTYMYRYKKACSIIRKKYME